MNFRNLIYAFSILLFLVFPVRLFAQDFNRTRTFDVQHYKIKISFDRKNKTVFGDTTVSLKPLNANLKIVELDAAGMTFESVKLENENKDLKYRLSGDKIFIELAKTFQPKDLINDSI